MPGLYIHIPFCDTKCSYCSFLSGPADSGTIERYTQAVAQEFRCSTPQQWCGAAVDTIYFGGGTPSLAPLSGIEHILGACREVFAVAPECEITLEANPGTFDAAEVQAYCEVGINRISLGAQSFLDSELASIDRGHRSSQTIDAVEQLRSGGMGNVNLDLLLGVPDQTGPSWLESLANAAALDPTHISVYMLDLSPESPLHRQIERGDNRLPPDDEVASWYLDAIAYLESAGYAQYEISNFCREGFACRHNLKYWYRTPVLGYGLGSHSFDGSRRYANTRSLSHYLDAVERGASPLQWSESVGDIRGFEETIFLGLRLREGLDWDTIEARCESSRREECENRFRRLREEGLVEWNDRSIRLTPRGMLISNEVFQEFIGM
jgi:oxygen-independent coproporphyrinogen-3 oxidase